MKELLPYLTAFTAIFAAYFGFRHQQRLRAFELFYTRRQEVLRDLENMYSRLEDLSVSLGDDVNTDTKHEMKLLHDVHILYNKVKGGAFGELVDREAERLWDVLMAHPSTKTENQVRVTNLAHHIAKIHGYGHRSLSFELRRLGSFFPLWLLVRAYEVRQQGKRDAQRKLPK